MLRIIKSNNYFQDEGDKILAKHMKLLSVDEDRVEIQEISVAILYKDSNVVASIRSVMKSDGTIDKDALEEYEDFLLELVIEIEKLGYVTLEEHGSDKSETSYYITAYKEPQSTAENIKKLYFIRISDHGLNEDVKQLVNRNRQNEIDRYKKPKDKKNQRWRYTEFRVDSTPFDSYKDVKDDILDRLRKL